MAEIGQRDSLRLLRQDARDAWECYRSAPILFWTWLLSWHAVMLALLLLAALVSSSLPHESRFMPLEDGPLLTSCTMMVVLLYKAMTSRKKERPEGQGQPTVRTDPVASDAAVVLAFMAFLLAASFELIYFLLEPWTQAWRWVVSILVSLVVSYAGALHWGQDQDIRAKAMALSAARDEDAEAARRARIDAESRTPPGDTV